MRWIAPLFTLASLVSLLLMAGVVALWARSYSGRDAIGWEHREVAFPFDDGTGPGQVDARVRGIVSWRGGLWIGDGGEMTAGDLKTGPKLYTQQDPPPLWEFPYERLHSGWTFAKLVRHGDPDRGERGWYRGLLFPHWAAAAVTAILPIAWLVGLRKPKRRAGDCPECGYDLRATPGRCPECGYQMINPAGSRRSKRA